MNHSSRRDVLAGQRERSSTLQAIERATRPVDAHEAIVSEVVGRCAFGPLAQLPVEAIDDCRRRMPRFRSMLSGRLAVDAADLTGSAASPTTASPAELADLILTEYRRVRGRTPEPAASAGATWDVVGAVLPHSVIVKAMGKRIEWFKYRGQNRPFMLLGRLQQYTSTELG